MRAVVYNGPRDVSVQDVPDPRIETPRDAIVKIITTNICGSDLHMYEGRTSMEPGRVLGHENYGEVVEVGDAVERIAVGDIVSVPFNVACGTCKNCGAGLTNYCIRANPEPGLAGAAYGFADMGPYQGGQAEYLRVPWADFNCCRMPEDGVDKQNDYVMLADIFPTGYHATEMAGVRPGESVVIMGAGPVGLMAALSCVVKNASKVMVVDRHPDRLRLAESIGAIAVDDSRGSPVEQVLELTGGEGADRGCECVGYQAHDPQGREHPDDTLNKLVECVRFTGGIGVVGVFIPDDPGASDELSARGRVPLEYGLHWFKGQTMGSGQCPVKRYDRHLRNLIHTGRVEPSFLLSHELPLSEAPDAYAHFDKREPGWTKVTLKPGLG
ncbi:glutathione-independent formaldehyde dehydrogenase [Sphaerisporangium sp. TRM90804]|uniref:glutathione-independent formaldehyde dehydrogenase n=1 Tax=Sphaerisporangium sp. TRM90804 TaxID=3031113 RepID=UPI0024493FDE|nr:glutathione-independent formaldehyde dehydrogenase [Sphaerisporangium sp. TRM90804]MDH2426269.1 glutathione-independent formaldehyde dehydrogenase [Sphaerisporangium sp. TRM90804]